MSRLALLARPRYHFSGVQGEHWERPPYRNHQAGSEHSRQVTRFIALAGVGNKTKQKWLYAFNISPLCGLSTAELAAAPGGVTDMPYREQHLTTGGGEKKAQDWRWDMSAKQEEEGGGRGKKRKHEDGGPPRPAGPCWFCLSSAEVEKHLIVSVGTHCYLALPKGGLTEDHVLILPVGHHSCYTQLPEEVEKEVVRFKSVLRKMYKKHSLAPVFFERNYKTQHMQIQVLLRFSFSPV